MGRVVFFWVLVAMLVAGPASAGSAEKVEYVPARSYGEVALREIGAAKESVTVCMYLLSLRSVSADRDVVRLVDGLLKARDAGVRVEIYLDQGVAGAGGEQGFNGPAVAFLRGQGIAVYEDDATAVAHGKAVVIDGKTVLLGSTNWTDAALNKNLETNILVRSTAAASGVLADLRRGAWRREADGKKADTAEIPLDFLKNPKWFGAMGSGRDERALDVALWLFTQSTGTLTVDMDRLAEVLGMGGWAREKSRRQIIKTLKKLETRYGLIRADYTFSKDPRVSWTCPREGGGVGMPEDYWRYGWNRRLSLPGKCFLLVGQAESAAAVTRPRWSVARTTLARRYHVSAGLLSRGISELRRQNLVEVEYGPLNKDGPDGRSPSLYTPNPFYDPAETDARRRELTERYGRSSVRRAETTARLIYEDNDVGILEELIQLENRYGRERMEHGVAVLSRMNVDNPKRTFVYLKGIVQKEGRPGPRPPDPNPQ